MEGLPSMVTSYARHAAADLIRASDSELTMFGLSYDRHADSLYRFAYRRVGPVVADDVLIEAFLAAFRHRRRFDARGASARLQLFRGLVRELAHHHLREAARFKVLARAIDEAVMDGVGRPANADTATRQARAALFGALADLAPCDRDVLLLVAWSDLAYADVSRALGIPFATMWSRLHRARNQVRIALGGVGSTMDMEDRRSDLEMLIAAGATLDPAAKAVPEMRTRVFTFVTTRRWLVRFLLTTLAAAGRGLWQRASC